MRDLTGQKFGRYTVECYGYSKPRKYNNAPLHFWKCVCDCGNIRYVDSSTLTTGASKSCGCLRKEVTSNLKTTHGMSKTRLYKIWLKMKERCYYPKFEGYKNYGARGISICNEWFKFENFKEWALKNGYKDDLSIDRIDVNGNYEPSNCRWSTEKEQSNNRRSNVPLTYNGKTQNMKQWAEEIGISHKTIWRRLNCQGWSIEEALTTPVRGLKHRVEL